MPYTTVNNPNDHYHTQLYTGDGNNPLSITNDAVNDFQPDFMWLKNRDSAGNNHLLFTSTFTGSGYVGHSSSDQTYGLATATNKVTSFNSDGFTVANHSSVNANGDKYATWQWVANGGTTTSFTESGDNPGGNYQANTVSGFSMVKYTGTGAVGTVQHGLGAVPQTIWIKDMSEASSWIIYHHDLGNTDYLRFNTNNGTVSESSHFNNTSPTSSVFTVATSTNVNKDGNDYLAYVFAEKQGFSKFGRYTGNGLASGPFIYCGFQPAFFMCKQTNVNNRSWSLLDNARGPNGDSGKVLVPNEDGADENIDYEISSIGWKFKQHHTAVNDASGTYMFWAFAKHPLVTSTGAVGPGAFFNAE